MPKIPKDVAHRPQKTTPTSRESSKPSPMVTVEEKGDEFILEFNEPALDAFRSEYRRQTGNPKARLTEDVLRNFAIRALTDFIAKEGADEPPSKKPRKKPKRKSTDSPKPTDT